MSEMKEMLGWLAQGRQGHREGLKAWSEFQNLGKSLQGAAGSERPSGVEGRTQDSYGMFCITVD